MTKTLFASTIIIVSTLTFMFVWSWRDYALDHCQIYKAALKARWKDLFATKTLFKEAFLPLLAVWFIAVPFAFDLFDFDFPALNYVVPILAMASYWFTQYEYLLRLWKSMQNTPI